MTNVLIVDDEQFVQELFSRFIAAASDRYALAGVAFSAADTEIICKSKPVDLILMDICTAKNASGLDAAARVKALYPQIKVIMITSAPEFRFIQKAREAGADSFWYKEVSESELLDVMERTMAGQRIYPDKPRDVEVGLALSGEFTRRELEVLLRLAEGKSSRTISSEMNVAEETVKTHTKHLMEKTGCKSRTALAVLASKTKLVLPEY